MAKKIKGKNGHLCIEMTMTEAIDQCKFGISSDGESFCDNCNEILFEGQDEPVYYIAVLNMLFCKECFDDYIENAPYYEEDKIYEKNHYNHYSTILNIKDDGES